jgi:type 1 fimbriae regulatory protein FimB
MNESIKYFTQEELRRLLKVINASGDRHALRNYVAFRIAYRCALRASEVGLLKLEYYNKAKGELYCRRLKGSWNNTISLDKETIRSLNKYIKEYQLSNGDELLFKSQESKALSRKTLDYLMKRYCELAIINDRTKWHFHTLKHSIAVHLAESNLDIKELNFWLGHKSLNSTLWYFQFTASQHKLMLDKIKINNMLV